MKDLEGEKCVNSYACIGAKFHGSEFSRHFLLLFPITVNGCTLPVRQYCSKERDLEAEPGGALHRWDVDL